MGTRSRIAVEDGESGAVRSIYCHWDGYPKHNGRILVDHYRDRAKVDQLMDLGDLSILGAEIGEKQDFDSRDRPGDWCLAFGRDRGETGVDAVDDVDDEAVYARAQEGWEEYVYLYRQGVWFVTEVGGAAGPFLVNANDPNAEAESRWQRVEAVLALGDQALELGRSYAIG